MSSGKPCNGSFIGRLGRTLIVVAAVGCGGGEAPPTGIAPPARTFEPSDVIGSWSVETETATPCWDRDEVIELDVLFALPATNAAAVQGILGTLPIPVVGVVDLLEGSFQVIGASARRSEDLEGLVVIAWMGGTIVRDSGSLGGSATLDFEGFTEAGAEQEPFDCRGPVTLSKSDRL